MLYSVADPGAGLGKLSHQNYMAPCDINAPVLEPIAVQAEIKKYKNTLYQRFLNVFSRTPLALVIDTRTYLHTQNQTQKQNNNLQYLVLWEGCKRLC